MDKITSTNSQLFEGSVTRLTGRHKYLRVGLTAAIAAANTCQSSHRNLFRYLKVISCSFLTNPKDKLITYMLQPELQHRDGKVVLTMSLTAENAGVQAARWQYYGILVYSLTLDRGIPRRHDDHLKSNEIDLKFYVTRKDVVISFYDMFHLVMSFALVNITQVGQ